MSTEATGAKKPAEKAKPAEAPKGEPRAPHVGVVYFHGMGSQRRYEETSYLVDQIDRYLGNRHRSGASLGLLRDITACVEPLHPAAGQPGTIGYIRAKFSAGPQTPEAQTLRFYEVYWAPVMAEQKSPLRVLKWIFSQPLRPFKTLRSPWRERQRLRRAALVAMFERERATATPQQLQDYRELLQAYDAFEGLPQQRRFPEGSFDQFIAFVGESEPADPNAAVRRQALARRWQSTYQADEIRNAVVLFTMALALLLCGAAAIAATLLALQHGLGFGPIAKFVSDWNIPIKADWSAALLVLGTVAGLFGLTRFLTDYMGDVEAWATYEETDARHMARNKVLERSLEVLTHAFSDPACERVAVVAHSLGTSVAHDALLALSRRNRAYKPEDPMTGPVPLTKLEHFVTMGSPIDKIEYFFESYASNSHRYKRVVEDLRGDIGSPPFSRNGKPHVHWINFWDQGDPISGPLHSPAGSERLVQRVDNVHVASYRFPAPGASHAGYFGNETVIGCLFQAICNRAGSFRALKQPGPKQSYDYESVYLGLGEPLGARKGFAWMALLTPWLAAAGVAGWFLGAPYLALGAGCLSLTMLALLGLGYFASATAGQNKPF